MLSRKKSSEWSPIMLFLQIFWMLGLIEDNCIVTYIFNLLPYVLLIEVYEENPAVHNLEVEKRRILTVFLDSCGCSALILFQNLTRDNFLKINCKMGSNIISMDV